MSTIQKKKIRIKKKNFTIFIIFIILLVYSLTEISFLVFKAITTQEKPQQQKKIHTKKQKKQKTTINENIDYYNPNYKERYKKYKEKNKELSNEQIIKNVNMNLDLIPYKDTIKAKNLNTEKILVNKYYYLEEDYIPKNLKEINKQYALSGMKLVDEAKEAFEDMAKQAKKENLNIIVMSSYRSYSYQINLYNRYVKSDGKDKADTYSGRPGHSEHQTGLAIDVYNKKENYTSFEKTKEFDWMQDHAHEYGFILRFPKGKEDETGYIYESWHYRYVGKEIAKYIKEKDISFEEYYATIIKDW